MIESSLSSQRVFELIEQNQLEELRRVVQSKQGMRQEIKNYRSLNGWSAELFSARFGYKEILQYLLENIFTETNNRKLADLILLNIHAGSLSTVLYLTRHYSIPSQDLNQFLVNACKLDKERLAFFFIVRGAHVVESIEGQQVYYNCYKKQQDLFDLHDEQTLQQEQIYQVEQQKSNSLVDISQVLQGVKLYNYKLIKQLQKIGKQQKSDSKQIDWSSSVNYIENSSYLKESFTNMLK